MDKTIRILVANRPKLMRDVILATLADEPGIEIVGEVSNDAEISNRVDQTRPDLLVISLDEPGMRPPICDTVLLHHPQVRIIAVAADQNSSTGYWASFDIHSDDIESSEAGILNAVRSMAAGVGGGS
jgi:chemotaxis response regulator CheB